MLYQLKKTTLVFHEFYGIVLTIKIFYAFFTVWCQKTEEGIMRGRMEYRQNRAPKMSTSFSLQSVNMAPYMIKWTLEV